MHSLRTTNGLFGYTRSAGSSKLQVRNCNDGGDSLTSRCSLRFLTYLMVSNRAVPLLKEPQDLPMDGCGLQMVTCCKGSIRVISVGMHYLRRFMLKGLLPTERTILLARIFVFLRLHVISKLTIRR